jgi:hypothetical protein
MLELLATSAHESKSSPPSRRWKQVTARGLGLDLQQVNCRSALKSSERLEDDDSSNR